MSYYGQDILALSDLLHQCRDNAQDEEQLNEVNPISLHDERFMPLPKYPIGQIPVQDPKAIWLPEEILTDDEDDDVLDTRVRPVFEILYKQNVMTEDVFLRLSDKDPSTAHCETIVIRIVCPGHVLDDIQLDLKKQKLLLSSSALKLALPLQYPVRDQDGKAIWDSERCILSISVPILRDEW